MSLWEGWWVSEQQAEEQLRQVQAIVEGDRKARMRAHRYKEPEVARSIHAGCLSSAGYHAERGNVCMAHAKRLQAKYWARRMFSRKEDVFAQYAETVLKMMEDEA